MHNIIEFTSEFDGGEREVILAAPDGYAGDHLPLVIVPHAAGWTAESTSGFWRDIPMRHGVIAVFPFGKGRKLHNHSLGWHGHIQDLAFMPALVEGMGYRVDHDRVYAAGISMGAQESLLLAGRYPDLLAGVVSFDAVTDLSTWFPDAGDAAEMLVEEIGGTPKELPDEYAERSPITYAEAIARVPVLLYWDPNDETVPHQDDGQSGLLYRRVRELNPEAPIRCETHDYGHQWIDPELALCWLLEHRRG